MVLSAISVFLILAGSVATSASNSGRVLAANPLSVSFGNIQVGNSLTQHETLTNSGYSTVTISQATVTGARFSLYGLSLPLSLNKGQSVTFSILFTPRVGGTTSGGITIGSNASNPSLTIALSGYGIPAGQLTSSAPALNFGSLTVGTSKTLTAILTVTGSSTILSSATSTSAEFSLGGISLPKTIAAGQSVSLTLTFTPRASGSASGIISLASNAANTPTIETLTGSGTVTTAHSVSLSWNSSPSAVVGYNLYRGAKSGGPYAKVNSVLNASTSYTDNSVQAGTTYYYVSTAVNGSGTESMYSNQLQAVIPSP
jgi:Abnormal spindle-like microcephaly-assoc'd, ASPM-SPD-2-Hydin